jgi:hypothetical protein
MGHMTKVQLFMSDQIFVDVGLSIIDQESIAHTLLSQGHTDAI